MKFKLSFITITLSTLLFTGFSCRNKTASAPQNQFLYYPEKNVYYDAVSGFYYYSLDNGKTWDSLAAGNGEKKAALGKGVPLARPEANAWDNNNTDQKTYHGNALNIVNEQTALIAREDSLRRIKPVVIVKTDTPEEKPKEADEEEPKKGLKKLIDRIFGKRKAREE